MPSLTPAFLLTLLFKLRANIPSLLLSFPQSVHTLSNLLQFVDVKYRKQLIASLFFARAKILQFFRDFILSIFLGQAIIKRNDEAYDWMLNYISKQKKLFLPSRRLEVQSINQTVRGQRGQKSILPSKSDGKFRYVPATNEATCFRFEGVFFWALRKGGGRRDSINPYGRREYDAENEIKLYFLAFTSGPLKRLLAKAKRQYKREARPAVTVKHLDRNDTGWTDLTEIEKRSMESIHLPLGIKEQVLNNAKEFISKETYEFFKERNIPYRRGYLLYGEPGSGKTSLCHALASAIDRSIYVMNLAENSFSDNTFNGLMSDIPRGCIVVMEDIDAAFVKRSNQRPLHTMPSSVSEIDGNRGIGISFSTLLNAIDGIGAAEGRLLCLTTNHIEKLDQALIRPGRIDLRIKFTKATAEQAKEIFLHWYLPKKLKDVTTDEKDARQTERLKCVLTTKTEMKELDKDEKGNLSSALIEDETAKVQQMAEEFSQKITPDTVSVAAIQGYLLMCGKDYNKVLQGADDWLAGLASEQESETAIQQPSPKKDERTVRERRSRETRISDGDVGALDISDTGSSDLIESIQD